jgi:alpha-galactosidase
MVNKRVERKEGSMEIAIVGAGSHFTLALLRSIYQQSPEGGKYHLRFMDIRPEPLEALSDLLPRMNSVSGRQIQFSFHHDLASAIQGADHILASFAVDFPASFLRTCWVMHDHGLQFVEGETATPGALMATLRHLPPLISLAESVKEHTAGAWLHIINNPMPRLIRGVMDGAGYDRIIGHCHGTLDTRERISALTGVPANDIDLFIAGINHFHVVQRAVDRRNGADMLKDLKHPSVELKELWKKLDFTQWTLFREVGFFLGCGNWHNYDYVPYSNKRMFRHADYNTWERACLSVQARREAGTEGEIGSNLFTETDISRFLSEIEREQMFPIMRSLSGEAPEYFYLAGNMPNEGHIADLPDGAIVELPAKVDENGIALCPSSEPLPVFFRSWVEQQLAIHELSVRATLDRSRQAALEAIACDPVFRDADCSPAQLLDEMLSANDGLVPVLS